MWLCSIVAEPPLSTRTPYSMLSQVLSPGPCIVNCWMSTLWAWTRTIAFGVIIAVGAWMTAWSGFFDWSVRLSLPVGIVTCSA